MSDNGLHVVLVTKDPRLREALVRHRPRPAVLHCLSPEALRRTEPPAAEQWWVDLDGGTDLPIGACHRRVYFYSQLPTRRHQLPTGLFLRKPCAAPVATILWAGVTSRSPEPARPGDGEVLSGSPVLPAWLLRLHELDLHELCHRCVETLPPRLGYAEAALYLHDEEKNLLALAQTNGTRSIDLAVPLDPSNTHVLAAVVRSGRPLVTQNLAEACRVGGMRCPGDLEHRPHCPAAIAPLISRARLFGALSLTGRRRTDLSELGLPLEHVFGFVARCLEHAQHYLQARTEARVDLLTGLFNYRWMVEATEKEILRSQRYGSPLTLIMIDLDGLKSVNDRFGHLAGDALLRHAAGKIGAALRQIDSAARVGGDEFVVLLPATAVDGAGHVARRILASICTDAPVVAHRQLPVAASLGVAQWRDGWGVQQLMRAADQAMYAAKHQGRNRLASYPHEGPPGPAIPTALLHTHITDV